MATNTIGSGGLNVENTFFDEFVPELWSEGVRYYWRQNLVFGGLATDWSDVLANGGDTIHIPRINKRTSSTKTQGTAIVWTHDATSEGEDVLYADQHAYAPLLIEKVAQIQASDDLMSKYTNELGYALAKAIDDKLENTLQAVSNTIELGTATGVDDFSKGDIATLVKTLGESDIDWLAGDVYLVLKPSLYSSLFKLDDFARADVIGDSFGYPRVSGFIGSLVGIPVYVSTVVDTGTAGALDEVFGYLFHKSALNVAFSQLPQVTEQFDIDYLGTKVVADAIYGTLLIGGASNADERRAWKIVNGS